MMHLRPVETTNNNILKNCCAVSYFGKTFSRLLKDTLGEREALRIKYTELETRYNQLWYQTNGPDGLRSKAARYDMLIQAFVNLESLAAVEQASTTYHNPAPRFPQQQAQTAPNPNSGVICREVMDDQPEFHAEVASGIVHDTPNSELSKAPQSLVQPSQEEDAADTVSGDPQAVDNGRATSTQQTSN